MRSFGPVVAVEIESMLRMLTRVAAIAEPCPRRPLQKFTQILPRGLYQALTYATYFHFKGCK